MLSQLTIRNFAIVDHIEIDWHGGLNVITGETGAGKSILMDAVGALLGDRLGPDVVRGGAGRALIEGVFTLPKLPPPELVQALDEYGLEPEDGALIVSREIAGGGGRGGARVNGRSVPLAVLQEVGEHLVDMHGQSEHMALLRPREQLGYLDRYAGVLAERGNVAKLFRQLRAARAAQAELLASEREMARLQDMLRYEVAEIERAGLREGDEEELGVQRTRLEHAERLREAALMASQWLTGDAEDQPGASDLLARAVAACAEVARVDPALATEAEALQTVLDQAAESARTLRDYADAIEADPEALERTTERLFLIGDLKRKYGESIREVLAYAVDARRRLGEIDRRAQRLDELEASARALEAQLESAAQALSIQRREAATELVEAVRKELNELRLTDAGFAISVERTTLEPSGVDRVTFQLGQEARAMSRVVSGGELARIALALKAVLTQAETRPTLIFDEIDVGVGGRTGPVVGQKLRSVATAGHQVLCVTHLPQVAAFAESHYVVTRAGGEVHVERAEGDQRVDELAAMLAGSVTTAARQSALELLERVNLSS